MDGKRVFDLEERTAKFGENVIDFVKGVPQTTITAPLIDQLLRAGTSVGANYCEADDAVSRKEFRNKIGICRKEARETKFWLKMMIKCDETLREKAFVLWQEARELHLIFASIMRKLGD